MRPAPLMAAEDEAFEALATINHHSSAVLKKLQETNHNTNKHKVERVRLVPSAALARQHERMATPKRTTGSKKANAPGARRTSAVTASSTASTRRVSTLTAPTLASQRGMYRPWS